MHVRLRISALALGCGVTFLGGCETSPPPPVPRPEAFTPLGLNAPYLYGDVLGGHRSRAAKMKAAKIRPLRAGASAGYMAELNSELRTQTAGIGLDVVQVGNAIIIRIPAALTFDEGSASVKPQFDATLLEISREVKNRNQTFVDVFAHTDLVRFATGKPGALGPPGGSSRNLSRRPWRLQSADRIQGPRRDRSALQPGNG